MCFWKSCSSQDPSWKAAKRTFGVQLYFQGALSVYAIWAAHSLSRKVSLGTISRGAGWILLGMYIYGTRAGTARAQFESRASSLFCHLPSRFGIQSGAERQFTLGFTLQHIRRELSLAFAVMGNFIPYQLCHHPSHLDEQSKHNAGRSLKIFPIGQEFRRDKGIGISLPSSCCEWSRWLSAS
jgi:hypothetical protein